MCGITGIWNLDKKSENKHHLEAMTAMLEHRGPDDFGFYEGNNGEILFGHSRLSIIDLSGGHQPFLQKGSNNALVVNGEFYDYQQIRTNLICQGYEFQTKSDCEIAMPLYQQYGMDFIHHLRGEFAFAFFDNKEEKLILARDRFGIRPLFYTQDSRGNFYFASEIKALMAHPEVKREFDPKMLLNQCMHTMVPGTTAFKNIYALKPGTMLIIQKKSHKLEIKEECYWDFNFGEKDSYQNAKPAEYYIEEVQKKLIEAVQLRLVADVPVGCYLSGGIDSCSILGLANAFEQKSLRAYTISFDHDAYDELSIAKEMAKKTGAEQVVLKLKSDDLYGENYVKTLWHSERCFYNTLGVAKWHMSKRVHANKDKVVITGEGSDELFGGYPAFKLDFALRDPEGFGSAASEILEKNKMFVGHILSEKEMSHPGFESLCGFTPSWIQPWMMTLNAFTPLINQDVLNGPLKGYDPIQAIVDEIDASKLKNRHPLDAAQYTWVKTMLECQILNWGGDRVDMANSMESRPAFLDHHLAEFAATIPPKYRIHNGTEKYVLREAMKGILPEVLYKREKFAFMAPPAYTDKSKQGRILELAKNYSSSSDVQDLGFFDSAKIEEFFKNCFNSDSGPLATRNDILINHILGIQVLHKLFIQADLPQQAKEIRNKLIKESKWIRSS